MSDLYLPGLTGGAVSVAVDDGVGTGSGTVNASNAPTIPDGAAQFYLSDAVLTPEFGQVTVTGGLGRGGGIIHGIDPEAKVVYDFVGGR